MPGGIRQARKMRAFVKVANITDLEDWEKKVIKRSHSKLVFVEFTANWNPGCKAMQPYINQLSKATEYKDVQFVRVDTDAAQAVVSAAGIRLLPSFQCYRNGEEVQTVAGTKPQEVAAMLERQKKEQSGKNGGPPKVLLVMMAIAAGVGGFLWAQAKGLLDRKEGSEKTFKVKRGREKRKRPARPSRAGGRRKVEVEESDSSSDEEEDDEDEEEEEEEEETAVKEEVTEEVKEEAK